MPEKEIKKDSVILIDPEEDFDFLIKNLKPQSIPILPFVIVED